MTRQLSTRLRTVVAGVATAALLALHAVVAGPGEPAAAAVPSGFTEQIAFSGLVNPTSVKFAADGRVFVAEKRGTVQMFDNLTDTTPTRVADLRTEVYNFWDRGLLGLALDPAFTTGRPYLYALYTFDGAVGGTAPRWGTAGADSDPCPTPPGATADGCVVSGKLVKLTLTGTTTSKQDLIHDWCQQYPSHSVGDVMFGRDGALYVSGGDGASFNFVDYGQDGAPLNPCGDPPGGPGATLTAPNAQGGALRSQDVRTTGDPTGLDGTIIRVHPDTGAAMPNNPAAASADPNTRRIIASGLRNPFRLTQRPGTDEVWVGDVGWSTWEEVNRVVTPTAGVVNFGWPCYEGAERQSGYDAANLSICEDLYAQPAADTEPYFPYRHRQSLNASDNCNATSGSSTAGISFSFYSGGPYPAELDGALFFADYSRDCIWVMTKGADGLPDRVKAKPFVQSAASPVDLELSPAGELFYAGFDDGTVRRIVHQGTVPATCPVGQYRAEYFPNTTLTGTAASTVCESAPLARDFGTGGPAGVAPDNFSARWSGSFDFPAGAHTFTAVTDDGMRVWVDGVILIDQWRAQAATTYTATRTLTAGRHDVRVEYYEQTGGAVARLGWAADGPANAPPQAQISTPAAGTTWRVGDTISFSGSATDAEDGTLPAGALRWEAVMQHCPGGTGCHDHVMQTFDGVATGSFPAEDHEYPSKILLRMTATDSRGGTDVETLVLEPRTASITVASQPAGLQLTVGQQTATAPFTTTVILGGTASLSAPSPQTLSGTSYAFGSWSDAGGQSHNITADAASQTYTATYSATGPAGTRTQTVDASADTTVRQELATTNLGTATSLKVDTQATDGNTATRATSYLRFAIPALAAGESVTGAALSLNVTNGTSNGPAIWPTATTWTETSMTYSSGQPGRSGAPVAGNFASMGTGRVSVPVQGVTAGSPVSFQLDPESSDGMDFSSRETTNRPQLVLTIATGGDTTPPPAPAVSPASGTYASAQTVTATSTEAGVTHRYTVGTGTTVPPDPTTASPALPSGGLPVSASSVVKVASFDAAGNRSTVVRRDYTISAGPGGTRTVVLDASADTMVNQSDPTRTFGGATILNVDSEYTPGNAATRTSAYLRFTVPALAAGESITAATLSVDVTNATADGPDVWRTSPTWTEGTMSWNTGQPARSGTAAVGDFAGMALGRQSTPVLGVTEAGTVSFQLYADATDGLQISSRETANDPRLTLTIRTP